MMNYQKNIFVVKDSGFRLTPKQAESLRRYCESWSETDRMKAFRAIQEYSYFLHAVHVHGGRKCKRPNLHKGGFRSEIICPICPEVLTLLEDLSREWFSWARPYWPRQQQRRKRQAMMSIKPFIATIEVPDGEEDCLEIDSHNITPEQTIRQMYGDTPVVFKKFGQNKTTVLVIFDGNRKNAEVYEINNGIVTANKSSRAQRYTDAELKKYQWQHGKLGDPGFESILRVLEMAN